MGEKIPIGADHAGFELKERLKAELRKLGYEPVDVGTNSTESTDYPDYAKPVAEQVSTGTVHATKRFLPDESLQGFDT